MVRTVPGRTDRVVVVGAGLAGLSAALRLRGAGREVTVVERASGPGGRAGRIEERGYALDTGPSVFTAPELVADTLAAVGEKLEDRLTLVPLETTYRAQFADGSHLDVHADVDAFAAEVEALCGPGEATALRRYLADLAELYRL
jgi:phytoene desaturase